MKMLRRRPGVHSQKLRRTLGVHDTANYGNWFDKLLTSITMCASIYSYAYPNTAQAQLLLHLYGVQISIFYIKMCLNPAFAGGGGVKRPHFFRRVITPVWRGAAAPNLG